MRTPGEVLVSKAEGRFITTIAPGLRQEIIKRIDSLVTATVWEVRDEEPPLSL